MAGEKNAAVSNVLGGPLDGGYVPRTQAATRIAFVPYSMDIAETKRAAVYRWCSVYQGWKFSDPDTAEFQSGMERERECELSNPQGDEHSDQHSDEGR